MNQIYYQFRKLQTSIGARQFVKRKSRSAQARERKRERRNCEPLNENKLSQEALCF